MKPNVTSQIASHDEFAKELSREVASNKFLFGFFGISVLLFIVFGILIWMIAFGLFYGLIKLAFIFDTPYRLLRWICRFDNLPSHLVKPPLKSVIYSAESLIFPFLFIYGGVKGLQNLGFYSQNLIWVFSRAFSMIFSY